MVMVGAVIMVMEVTTRVVIATTDGKASIMMVAGVVIKMMMTATMGMTGIVQGPFGLDRYGLTGC